jgi:hypothetical protein
MYKGEGNGGCGQGRGRERTLITFIVLSYLIVGLCSEFLGENSGSSSCSEQVHSVVYIVVSYMFVANQTESAFLIRSSTTNTSNPFGSTFCYSLQHMIFEVKSILLSLHGGPLLETSNVFENFVYRSCRIITLLL